MPDRYASRRIPEPLQGAVLVDDALDKQAGLLVAARRRALVGWAAVVGQIRFVGILVEPACRRRDELLGSLLLKRQNIMS
ncbi:MAG: hypothetical protein HY268_15885 [Deltaproteobacteria bacterium]|nr:hypothetical protein [Deltaproteobacteria bacterium]